MWIVEGDVTMTSVTRPGRLDGRYGLVDRGVEHELHCEGGLTFVEALAPVFGDHVPDADRDLVLGAQGDSLHADR